MSQDPHTFAKAARAALLGLVVQVVVGGALLAIAFAAAQPAALYGSLFVFGGALVWIPLWLLFNQQRLERLDRNGAMAIARR